MAFIRRCQYSSRCFPFSSVSSNSSSLPKAKATATTTTTTTTTSFNSNSNSNSIPTLLRACKTSLHLHQLHTHIIRKSLEQDHFLVTLSSPSPLSTLSYSTSIFNRVFVDPVGFSRTLSLEFILKNLISSTLFRSSLA